MRTLIGIFTFALCGLLCFQSANAQSKASEKIQGYVIDAPAVVKVVQKTFQDRTPEESATLQTNRMAEKLNLSSTQASQLYQVNLQTAQDVAQIRATRANNPQAAQQGVSTTYNERRTAVKSLLNTEQQRKYKSSTQKTTSFRADAKVR